MLVNGAENEEDDVDFDDGKKEGRRRRGGTGNDRERSLPPLLARVNGQIEVSEYQLLTRDVDCSLE